MVPTDYKLAVFNYLLFLSLSFLLLLSYLSYFSYCKEVIKGFLKITMKKVLKRVRKFSSRVLIGFAYYFCVGFFNIPKQEPKANEI